MSRFSTFFRQNHHPLSQFSTHCIDFWVRRQTPLNLPIQSHALATWLLAESGHCIKHLIILGLLGNFKIDRFQQVAGGVQNIHPPGTDLMGLDSL